MAKRIHLYPSRTQKLSSSAPKILGGRLPGKIGHCRFWRKQAVYAACFFSAAKRSVQNGTAKQRFQHTVMR